MTNSSNIGRSDERTIVLGATAPNKILIQKCKLLAASGPLHGKEFVLDKDIFTIGSDPHNHLVLHDSTVSRRHCEIHLTSSGYMIRDLGSTNGVVIQGVRITEALLNVGTEFQLGKTRLLFRSLREATEYALSDRESFGRLLGQSTPMRRVFYLAETYAPTNATILIEGETGTGKEILAEEIHRHSERRDKPFIVIDCASLARDLVVSELFGHTKGAFTGAAADRVGAFEHADGGTIFLDEIGELNSELQPQLLRVLEKREVRRLGSNQTRKVDVRIICATNRRLENEVNADRFREDLYYRLSVIRIELPPLRRRKEDIPLLTMNFLKEKLGADAREQVVNFDDTMRAFESHDWPGNVRELRNLVEIAGYSRERFIDLGAFLYSGNGEVQANEASPSYFADRPFKEAKASVVDEFEKQYLADLLKRHNGNISQAARAACIERSYLSRLLHKHGLKT